MGMEMKLIPELVNMLAECCIPQSYDADYVRIEGIVRTFTFDKKKLEEHREQIIDLVDWLPDEFFEDKGGGWSFLNLCNDRDGVQWTGLHQDMETLCCLAIAVDKGKWLLPREVWSSLPGAMPYISFTPRVE
jgi:hypothetical protein